MKWLKLDWGAILAGAIFSSIGSWIFTALVSDRLFRERAIVLLWFVVIIGVIVIVGIRSWRAASLLDPKPPGDLEGKLIRLSPSALNATGETLMSMAWSDSHYGFSPGDQGLIKNLRLGEVALIRRLAIAEGRTQPSRRCETVLEVSGITHARASISRLEDMRLVSIWGDTNVLLTERGEKAVEAITSCLTHDPSLVVAYRRVTVLIDQAIRFDGGPLESTS